MQRVALARALRVHPCAVQHLSQDDTRVEAYNRPVRPQAWQEEIPVLRLPWIPFCTRSITRRHGVHVSGVVASGTIGSSVEQMVSLTNKDANALCLVAVVLMRLVPCSTSATWQCQ